jgi:hypothetical protein
MAAGGVERSKWMGFHRIHKPGLKKWGFPIRISRAKYDANRARKCVKILGCMVLSMYLYFT